MDDVLRPPQDAQTLYDCDFAAWCDEQAALLRAAAGGAETGLDRLNLAEEIEGLANRTAAKSPRTSALSQST